MDAVFSVLCSVDGSFLGSWKGVGVCLSASGRV